MNKILRVGVIGCQGIFGSHLQAYPDHPNAVCVGFFDRFPVRALAQKNDIGRLMQLVKEGFEGESDPESLLHQERCRIFEQEAKVYDTIEDLIKNMDVIDICTPNYGHIPYAIWGLKENKSVMTEKPPARSSFETAQLCEVAKTSKGYYQINENFFWDVRVTDMKKLVDSGKLGDIKSVATGVGHGGPGSGWNNQFLIPSFSGGGCMSDMGIHAIGNGYGAISPKYKVKNIKAIYIKSDSKPDRKIDDADGANAYLLHRMMVEDDAKVEVIMEHEDTKQTIIFTVDTSWSRDINWLTVEGTKGTAKLDREKGPWSILFTTLDGKSERILLSPQGLDSHVLECVDFLNRVAKNERSRVDECRAHQMQLIITGAYLSRYLAFKKGQPGGEIVTPADLDIFYAQFQNPHCSEWLRLDDMVYTLMQPYMTVYYTPGQRYKPPMEDKKQVKDKKK